MICYYLGTWWFQSIPGITLFPRNTKQYRNFKPLLLQNSPFVQLYPSASDLKGVENKALFSSSVAFLIMSVVTQKRRPFNAGFSRGNR